MARNIFKAGKCARICLSLKLPQRITGKWFPLYWCKLDCSSVLSRSWFSYTTFLINPLLCVDFFFFFFRKKWEENSAVLISCHSFRFKGRDGKTMAKYHQRSSVSARHHSPQCKHQCVKVTRSELIRFVDAFWCEIGCHKYFEMGANSHRWVRHPLHRYGSDRTIWTLSAQENTPPLCWPPSSFSLLVCLSLLVRFRSNRNT